MSLLRQQIASDLASLIQKLQPSVTAQGNQVTIAYKGTEIKIDRFRPTTISRQTARFR